MVRRFFHCLLVGFVLLAAFPVAALGAPAIDAKSAVLMDADSGRVLFEKNEHERLPQASTTKITSAILALERGNFQDKVVVSKYAAETGGSAIWLETGEVFSLEELLYAMMLNSANDAAVAVAEKIAGSEEHFVKMMNSFARDIGCVDTHYVNPHGLHDDNHYSSAYDLALLARYAMKNPEFRKIVATRTKVIPWAGHEWDRLLINKNKFIEDPEFYPDADGIKNGFTTPAGYCLVASATKNGMRLIAVVMDSPNAPDEVVKLFDYGFKKYERTLLLMEGEVVEKVNMENDQELPLISSQPFFAAMTLEEAKRVKKKIIVEPEVCLPVSEGDVYGSVVYEVDGEVIGTVDLCASKTVEKDSWLKSVWRLVLNVFSGLS